MSIEEEGPIEARPWPTQLPARAVTPGANPQLFGYDVHGDLAAHYGLAEMAWLAVQGELPSSAEHSRAFEVVLRHLFAVGPEEAPSHAASLAWRCGTKPGAVTSIAALGLAEQARAVVEANHELWAWLAEPGRPWPLSATARPEEGPAVEALEAQLRALPKAGLDLSIFAQRPSLKAACLAALHQLGFREPEHLITVWVWCKLPCAMAEALVGRRRLGDYPMNVPKVEYEDHDD